MLNLTQNDKCTPGAYTYVKVINGKYSLEEVINKYQNTNVDRVDYHDSEGNVYPIVKFTNEGVEVCH